MNLQDVYKRLQLTDDCLIQLSDPHWKQKVSFPSRIMRLLEKHDLFQELRAFFCFDNKPLILFFENPQHLQKLHQAIWNFNESPIVIIITNNIVEIFNGFAIDQNTKLLSKLGDDTTLDDFSYFELVTGNTWEKYQEELSYKGRVDYRLLANIEAVQDILHQKGITPIIANKLIGKVIFIRYLIDRKVQLHFDSDRFWTNDKLCELLKDKETFQQFVQYLEDSETGFNGDMFKISVEDFKTITPDALNVIIQLLRSTTIKTGELSLFDIYDFSILPVEFISNVYEKFIGKENQAKEGAYYTPTFLVDYIVQETVGKHLENSGDNYNCKVLDPACGSGVFLVESLRKIIDKYIYVNASLDTHSSHFRETLKILVKENIYGIDKDESAIQVAIFSIYLTLLDYQEPADIEKFKFPNLLGENFICSDTFDTSNESLRQFEDKKIVFDYIIGNPPWKRGGVVRNSNCEKYLKCKDYLQYIGHRELAQAFVFRTLDFMSPNTKSALVLVSKVLYNLVSKKFRSFLLDNTFIHQIFELAPVRKEVFNQSNDAAIAPACVVFYQHAHEANTDNNIITHISLKPSRFFSLFKIFSLTKNDIQEIQQNRLKQYDWLWKVLVYGSYLDFIFIKRLKDLPTIASIISNSDDYVSGTGIQESSNPRYDSSHLLGLPFIDARAVDSYRIDKRRISTFDKPRVHSLRNTRGIFNPPMLLCRKTLDTKKLTLKSAIYADTSTEQVLFKDSLTSIRACCPEGLRTLRNISTICNSTLFSYLAINTFSSIGIEREQSQFEDKFNVPYIDLEYDYYSNFANIWKTIMDEEQSDITNDIKIKKQHSLLDNLHAKMNGDIAEQLHLNQIELDIMQYALDISMPLALKSSGYTKIYNYIEKNDKVLTDYANIFIQRFAQSFNTNDKRFVVEIHHSRQVISMFFKVIDKDEYREDIVYIQNENVMTLIPLSIEKITDSLFIQRDIRGFEKEYFYIIKPNERRLWHRAIAHLDVNEFDSALLFGRKENVAYE